MALLFADAVAKYNSEFRNEENNTEDTTGLSNKVADFLDGLDDDTPVCSQYMFDDSPTVKNELPQSVFMASIASEYYTKAKEDIANTSVGNKMVRKKNIKEIMHESFFYGATRYGTNFIA